MLYALSHKLLSRKQEKVLFDSLDTFVLAYYIAIHKAQLTPAIYSLLQVREKLYIRYLRSHYHSKMRLIPDIRAQVPMLYQLLDYPVCRSIANKIRRIYDTLLYHNARLIYSIVRRYKLENYIIEDIIQEAFIAAAKSIGRFDQRRGFKLSTFFTWWVRQAINKGINEQAKLIRIPMYIVTTIRHYISNVDANKSLTLSYAKGDIAPDLKLLSIPRIRMQSKTGETIDDRLLNYGKEDSDSSEIFLMSKLKNILRHTCLSHLKPIEERFLRLLSLGENYDMSYCIWSLNITKERMRAILKSIKNKVQF